MEEGRKRVLGIIAGIPVARHLKSMEDLENTRPSPRTEYLVSSAVRWAERIMDRIDSRFGKPAEKEGRRWPRAYVCARSDCGGQICAAEFMDRLTNDH